MADSSFFTVTGVEKRYSKSSPRSPEATFTATLLTTSILSASRPLMAPLICGMEALNAGLAGGGGAAIAAWLRPLDSSASYTTGAAARSSGNSTVWRATYFGSYNLLMNETGRPDTTDSSTLVQSSPVVLSIMAQPSSVGSVLSLKSSR